MKGLNNKGFTLVEVLAVIVILSILVAIMVPTTSHLIQMNKESNYENLGKTFKSMAKGYLSDNRYEIVLSDTCNASDNTKDIKSIRGKSLVNSHLPISWLVDDGYVKVGKDGNIINPLDSTKKLKLVGNDEDDTTVSYVLVKYQCNSKEFSVELETSSLIWVDK